MAYKNKRAGSKEEPGGERDERRTPSDRCVGCGLTSLARSLVGTSMCFAALRAHGQGNGVRKQCTR